MVESIEAAQGGPVVANRSALLQLLKQQTFSQHESLERQLDLLRPDLQLQEYLLLLESFYGFYVPWEQSAMPLLNRHFPGFLEERSKTPLLEKDLCLLGSNITTIPLCKSLPTTDSILPLLGSLYVLEGSTLGGQVLSRHFSKRFHFSHQQGCAFFASYGPDVGQRWRAFCELLASHSSPDHDPVIVASAVQTFDCLASWLPPRVLSD